MFSYVESFIKNLIQTSLKSVHLLFFSMVTSVQIVPIFPRQKT